MASRWGNITEFRGFDLITPNEREARFALGDQDSGMRPLAAALYDAAQCKTLILKLGDKGVLTCRARRPPGARLVLRLDSFVDRLVDGVGAGDALLAYSTLCMLATQVRHSSRRSSAPWPRPASAREDGNVPITHRGRSPENSTRSSAQAKFD